MYLTRIALYFSLISLAIKFLTLYLDQQNIRSLMCDNFLKNMTGDMTGTDTWLLTSYFLTQNTENPCRMLKILADGLNRLTDGLNR